MIRPWSIALLALGLLGAQGCNDDIQWRDSIDLEFDLFRTGDHVHSPYVVGATLTLCADAARDGELRGGELRSSDPGVLRVGATEPDDDDRVLCADVEALRAGEVEVEVVDDGDVIASIALEVGAPDRAEVLAAGPLLLERDDLDAEADRPRILAGGTATFEIRYFAGETRLHGQGALVVDDADAVEAQPVGTVVFEDREWLRITPSEPGSFDLELATPAGPFQTLTIDVVEEEDIADVALHGRDESGREKGDPMIVYAQAHDEDDAPIFGVEYEWSLAGEAEPGTGDLFRYEFDPSEPRSLVARHGDLETEVEIHAGEGVVDSSGEVGCSVAGRRGGGWALVLLVAGVLVRRRR